MFGRLVDVDGTQIYVPCTPQMPYSDVLRLAADQIAKEEAENYQASLYQRVRRFGRRSVA